MVGCIINSCTQELELDLGSSVNILTEGMLRNVRGANMRTNQKAKSYSSKVIKFIGKTTLNVKIKTLTILLSFPVVNNYRAAL